MQLNIASAQGVMIVNTDLLNTENTYIYDADDTGGDITLQFGNTLGEYLQWNDTDNAFKFSDDLDLENNQLLNARIENLASAPTCDGTVNGKVYHNTTNTNSYVCNGTSWVQIDGGGGGSGGDLAAVQARNSAGFTLTNISTWYDITMGNTDVETDSAVIEHDNTNTERINIKSTGTYLVTYTIDAVDNATTHGLQARVYINGTTVLNGSFQEGINFDGEHGPTTGSFLANLTTGDYITLQAQRLSANTIVGEPTLTVTKLDGVVGPAGPAGTIGNGTDENIFIFDQDDTGGDVLLQFGTTLNKRLGWDSSESVFSTFNEELSFRTQQSATPPSACSSTVAGMQWMDTDSGTVYICDTSNGRNEWLSTSELVFWGDESGSCPAGSDANTNENCDVDWGNGLGPDGTTDLGLYIPFPATITGYGFSADDDACATGSFDVEMWSTGSNADDNTYTLSSTVGAGLTGQAHNANNLNLDLAGNEYLLWGIDNNCGEAIDDFNVIVYLKWRHD